MFLYFFRNYYCSEWYQKHRICNWLVKTNTRYLKKLVKKNHGTFFRASSFSGHRLFGNNLFVCFINCEDPYLAEGLFHNFFPMFPYCVYAIRSQDKNKEKVCWNSRCFKALLDYNFRNQRSSCCEYTFQ